MHDIRRNPRLQLTVGLLFFFLVTVWHIDVVSGLFLLLQCMMFCVGIDTLFSWIRMKKIVPPYSAVVTGLILTLIIEPTLPWYQIALISLIAIAQKQCIRPAGRHIFNPAASGLLAGWLIFGQHPSWWAATIFARNMALTGNMVLNILLYIALGALVYVSGYRMKRYYTVGSFLIVFAVVFELFLSSFSLKSLIATLTSPGNLFYAFVMLPEPMTSPVLPTRQMLYGTFVAVMSVSFAYLATHTALTLPDTSLLALLLGNTLFFRFR